MAASGVQSIPLWLERRIPSDAACARARIAKSVLDALKLAFSADCSSVNAFVPHPDLQKEFALRGSEQWAYGELTAVGCRQMLDALLQPQLPPTASERELFVDVGSGAGIVVVFAALIGVSSIGVELVPPRHAAAQVAVDRLARRSKSLPVKLICADALTITTEYSHATRFFCNNAIWPDELTSKVATHIAEHAPRLAAFATVMPIPAEVVGTTGLALLRATAVDVTWDRIGAPLHIYVPAGREEDLSDMDRFDECYEAAREGCLGELSMF